MNAIFPGLHYYLSPELLLLTFDHPIETLSSAVVGGGFGTAQSIFILHVDKNYNQPDPIQDLDSFALRKSIKQPYLGMMTAAYVEKARMVTLSDFGIVVSAVTTAGVSNAVSAGYDDPVKITFPGTINIILLADCHLSPAGLVNAVITVTEAKTDTLRRLGIHNPSGEPATGTSTDAVVIAHTRRGSALQYAGPATGVGWLAARAVRQALTEVLA